MATETELLDIVVYSFKRVLVVTELVAGRTECFFLVALNTPFVHTEGSTYNFS